jgi:hypothetical protein
MHDNRGLQLSGSSQECFRRQLHRTDDFAMRLRQPRKRLAQQSVIF